MVASLPHSAVYDAGEAEMVTMDIPPRGIADFSWGLTSTIKDSAVIALWAIDPDAARKAGIKPPQP